MSQSESLPGFGTDSKLVELLCYYIESYFT